MKKIAIFSLLLVSALFVNAQDGASKGDIKFSAGAELGLPLGDAGEAYSTVIGASVQGDYHVSDKLALTLNAGYTSWLAEGGSINLSQFWVVLNIGSLITFTLPLKQV
jgi:hypothetical protein